MRPGQSSDLCDRGCRFPVYLERFALVWRTFCSPTLIGVSEPTAGLMHGSSLSVGFKGAAICDQGDTAPSCRERLLLPLSSPFRADDWRVGWKRTRARSSQGCQASAGLRCWLDHNQKGVPLSD